MFLIKLLLCVIAGLSLAAAVNLLLPSTASVAANGKSSYYQQLVDENTGMVCLGGITYYFGVSGNRSWLTPKIDPKAHNTYINCEN